MAPWDPFFFPSAAGSRVPRRRSKAPTVYAVRFILSPPWILKSFAVDALRATAAGATRARRGKNTKESAATAVLWLPRSAKGTPSVGHLPV